MINKFRLKVAYKENKITIDVDENITFKMLSVIINEKLLLNKCKFYEFIHNDQIIDSVNKEDVILKDYLELEQELIYHTGLKSNPYFIKIIVWDYVIDTDDAVIKKFMKLVKNLANILNTLKEN